MRFEDLSIDGRPIVVAGERSHDDDDRNGGDGSRSDGKEAPSAGARAAAGTDLQALDALGMRITMAYEVHRLIRRGLSDASVLIPGGEIHGESLVVDVHSPEAIRAAEATSAVARRVLGDLEALGVSRLYPGFDVLVIADGVADRLIELKSSGVDAYVQTMSWNEWKSARASHLRSLFWLYLVGNLRADLASSAPFVRAIGDPFGSLVGDEVHEQQVRRAVQLRVREFTEAEHLDLGVTVRPPSSLAVRGGGRRTPRLRCEMRDPSVTDRFDWEDIDDYPPLTGIAPLDKAMVYADPQPPLREHLMRREAEDGRALWSPT